MISSESIKSSDKGFTLQPLEIGWQLQLGGKKLVVNEAARRVAAELYGDGAFASDTGQQKVQLSPGTRALIKQFLEFYFFQSGHLSKCVNYSRLVLPETEQTALVSPKSASFLITKSCNMKCLHCYNNSGAKDNEEMTSEQRFQLAHYLGKWGVRTVTLTGGEPLLHPDLIPIMHILDSYRVLMTVSTNGWHFNDEFLHFVETGSVSQVNVSLDGSSAETHDTYRGCPGSYERVLSFLTALIQTNVKTLNLNVSAYHSNLGQLDQICRMALEFGVDSVSIKPILRSGRPLTPQEALLSLKDLDKFRSIRHQLREKYGHRFTIAAQLIGAAIPKEEEDDEECTAGQEAMFIDSNGDMLPCESVRDFFSAPNLRNYSPIEAWLYHETFRDFRKLQDVLRSRRPQGTTGCLASGLERGDYWKNDI